MRWRFHVRFPLPVHRRARARAGLWPRLRRRRWRIKRTTLLEDDADDRFPAFQQAWKRGAGLGELFGDQAFMLHGSVGGSGTDNHRPDVAKVETLLGKAGYYKPMTEDGPSGWHNTALDEGIKRFQKDNGLAVDGVLKPGGPTMKALQGALKFAEASSGGKQTMEWPNSMFRAPWKNAEVANTLKDSPQVFQFAPVRFNAEEGETEKPNQAQPAPPPAPQVPNHPEERRRRVARKKRQRTGRGQRITPATISRSTT